MRVPQQQSRQNPQETLRGLERVIPGHILSHKAHNHRRSPQGDLGFHLWMQGLIWRLAHRIPQRPNPLDRYLDVIARCQWPHSSRGSREHHIAREQGHNLGDIPDDVIQGEDENPGARRLFHNAV
jgi:hypothetical protein